jgi:hypothetical protein
MPQKSLANFVNEHGECTALRMPASVQLAGMSSFFPRTVINSSPE